MIRKILFIAFLFFSVGHLFAQTDLTLRIGHSIGSQQLVFDHEYTEPDQNYNFSIYRLQYYISDITITHDGGLTTALDNVWLLVDASKNEDLNLGSYDIQDVEEISFSIGVDPDHNHLDPTIYPGGHPLAPQNPSMHWGWASGYRFVALEGKTGFNLIFTYEIHALGDGNYFSQSTHTAALHENGKIIIPLEADYLGLYKNVNVSSGMIEHGEGGAAETLLQNFAEQVFSQVAFTGINQNKNPQDLLNIYPNPSTNGNSNISFNGSPDKNYGLKVTDIVGRVLFSNALNNGSAAFQYQFPGQGIYFVHILDGELPVATKKVIVNR